MADPRVPLQLRDRGRRGRAQARPPPHRRPNAIAFYGAFHGRSLGSLSLTASKARQRAGFGIVTPGSFHAPYWDPYDGRLITGADYIREVLFKRVTHPEDVAAIFVEPIQGEGGYIVPAGWLGQPCAGSATSTGSCSSSTRCSPASAAPARCGRASTRGSSPTS